MNINFGHYCLLVKCSRWGEKYYCIPQTTASHNMVSYNVWVYFIVHTHHLRLGAIGLRTQRTFVNTKFHKTCAHIKMMTMLKWDFMLQIIMLTFSVHSFPENLTHSFSNWCSIPLTTSLQQVFIRCISACPVLPLPQECQPVNSQLKHQRNHW